MLSGDEWKPGLDTDRPAMPAIRQAARRVGRGLAESSPDCVLVLDPGGRLLFVNASGLRLMECDSFAPLRGRPWIGFWPAVQADALRAAIAEARTGRTAQFTGFCPTAKGTPRWWDVTISPIPGANDRPARLLVVSRDITEARLAQDAAEASAARLAAVLEGTFDGVLLVDRHWRIVCVNQHAAGMIAAGRDLLGASLWEAFPQATSSAFARRCRLAMERQRFLEFEEFLDPPCLWLKVHVRPVPDDGLAISFRDISAQRHALARIEHMALHDPLTGLPNGRLLRGGLGQALARTGKGEGRRTAVLCLDLDQFKALNRMLGHAAGDSLLRRVTERLRGCLAEGDMAARLGSDEFAVFRAGVATPEEAAALARHIIEALAMPHEIEGQRVSAGTSIGIALAPDDGMQATELLKKADTALHRAKAEGRGTYRFFESGTDALLRERESLRFSLRGALERGEFELLYQPLVCLRSGRVRRLEALLRWQHPERGCISPDEFIGIAEDTGLIRQIGDWVLRQACEEAAGWPEEVGLAVNLSPVQFRDGGLVPAVAEALATSGLKAGRLELEVTETVLLRNEEANLATLRGLRDLGVQVAMDDFGTGYSSLGYLRSFAFDKLKIDRSFVAGLPDGAGDSAILRAILALGRGLGMTVTAEGVETWRQCEMLRREGCDEAQGYLFSRPVAATEVPALLQRLTDAGASALCDS